MASRKMFRGPDFKSPMCRLSYASTLFTPRKAENGFRESYGCTLIFPNSARAELEKYVAEALIGEWKEKGIERAKAGLIKSPFLKGDGKEARDKNSGELKAGMGPDVFFIRVQSGVDRPPFVIWKSPNVQETEQNVYSGCYGKAVLNAFCWYNDLQGDGVSFGIQGFQKITEGERLGGSGGADPEKFFEKIEDAGDAPESTTSGAGAAGLFG